MIMGGDQISDYASGAPNPKPKDWVFKYWKHSLEPLLFYNGRIPWATIMGNHDYGIQMTSDDILNFDASFPGSLTRPSNDTGFVLDILENKGSDVAARVWLFHSGRNGMLSRHIEWYVNKSSELAGTQAQGARAASEGTDAKKGRGNAKTPIPALAFVHIPLKETIDIYNSGIYRGSMTDRDGICCQTAEPNLPFYDTMRQIGDIKVVASGHDHGNDMIGDFGGIALGYGLKTGIGGYEVPVRGARIFILASTTTDDVVLTTIPGATLYSSSNQTSPESSTEESENSQSSTPEKEISAEKTSTSNPSTGFLATLKTALGIGNQSAAKKSHTAEKREVMAPGSNVFMIRSYLATSTGAVDEQLEINSSPPEFMILRCCVGPPKTDNTYAIAISVAVLVVELLILGIIVYFYMIRKRAVVPVNHLELPDLTFTQDEEALMRPGDEKTREDRDYTPTPSYSPAPAFVLDTESNYPSIVHPLPRRQINPKLDRSPTVSAPVSGNASLSNSASIISNMLNLGPGSSPMINSGGSLKMD